MIKENLYKLSVLFICSQFLINISSAEIKLREQNVTVWSHHQVIEGYIDSVTSGTTGVLYFDETQIDISVDEERNFSIPVMLHDGVNIFIASFDSSGTTIYSDTLQLTLGYKLKPAVYIHTEITGRTASLHCRVLENPDSSSLSFQWVEYPDNLSQASLENSTDSVTSVTFTENTPLGEYYFDVIVTNPDEDTTRARTFITVDSTDMKAFDIKNDYAEWIDRAIIYEVTPYIFANGSNFDRITIKIPELAELGVNVIWLQPIYRTHGGGQGYDITDYFNVRSDMGTEQDLYELIQTAKSYNMKVLFDFVANHSSINHPYARHSAQFGEESHYYDYYQRERDNAPYSQHYHDYQGFINYFWNELPNLNYDNPEVQRWITEAAKYWIEKFDIDGYRFDAIWGVNARNPEFTKQLRVALKSIKPEILMLAEDKASHPMVFDERFDAAYNWAPEIDWVSHWVWQTDYSTSSNPTIFNNNNENNRASLLRNSLNNNGQRYSEDARILRFMENNDTFRFITHHGLERTKMVAELIFSLNGIPLIYNGQETGKNEHPYETEFIYYPGVAIKASDPNGLFDFYKRLISLRKNIPALYKGLFEETTVSPNNSVYAFRRYLENQNTFTVINMGSNSTPVTLTLPIERINLDTLKTYYLTDMLSGEVISGSKDELKSVNLSIPGYTTRMLLLADTVMTVTDVNIITADNNVPQTFSLEQNYPNPFNPVTIISYQIPVGTSRLVGSVFVQLYIYDILGREIEVLVNEEQQPGTYKVRFDAGALSSGVYFYRMDAGSFSSIKKMILIK